MGDIKTTYAVGGVLAFPEVKPTGDTDNVVMVMTFESGCLGEIDIDSNKPAFFNDEDKEMLEEIAQIVVNKLLTIK